ncbi:MAG TPA: flavodoxin domain-containing protein [Nocardioides sp.]|nr:flavodoxin domain-containing protein [Nocardioides sp.]
MKAYVIYESAFGNTRQLAEAIAAGLGDAVTVDVRDVDTEQLADSDLVVLGGPTHAFSMSRPATRREALHQGGIASDEQRGIREVIAHLAPKVETPVATFDSRIYKSRKLPGSAARAASHALRRRHRARVVAEESFYVEDTTGPLVEGELERAESWGRELAART